jgi:hypothetical protein
MKLFVKQYDEESVDKERQAEHLKQHTLFSVIHNNYNRSKGCFKLIPGKKMVWDEVRMNPHTETRRSGQGYP